MTTSEPTIAPPILEVKNLAISYKTRKRDVPAVRGVSFSVREQETVGIVGESGCGKSTIAFGILDFLGANGKVVDGSIRFKGEELVGRPKEALRRIRGNQISMVYQDPMQDLNPSLSIGRQLSEVLTTHRDMSREAAWKNSIQMLDRVYMPDAANVMNRYPHMISGGQQQRVVIAMAMLNNPALLIMDEPTTALDVTVEAAVLDLIEDLKKDFNTGIIFITHNLGVVARVSNHLCVMYAGELVEKGPINDLFAQPAHPYTRGLLCCIPRLTDDLSYSQLWSIRGRVPPPAERSADRCIFQPRCDWAFDRCSISHPELEDIAPEHQSRCFLGRETLNHPYDEYTRGKRRILAVSENGAPERPEETLSKLDNVRIYY
ncbi:MAG: ABC transporter ATP-binding protein, partial [Desulfobacteraceae bacterium]|nr:ABC transporter ATP-binding protein [Desulfobacteraceae bacterium]